MSDTDALRLAARSINHMSSQKTRILNRLHEIHNDIVMGLDDEMADRQYILEDVDGKLQRLIREIERGTL